MPLTGLNHAVLYVRDVDETRDFYVNVLGFRVVMEMPGQAAFLQAAGSRNDHDLGVFAIGADAGASAAGRSTVGLYHLAWEVDTLAELSRLAGALEAAGALVGASDHSTTKSLYAHDPNGLEFEVCWLVPGRLVTDELRLAGRRITRLDLPVEIERYGADTRGGVGVSSPATV